MSIGLLRNGFDVLAGAVLAFGFVTLFGRFAYRLRTPLWDMGVYWSTAKNAFLLCSLLALTAIAIYFWRQRKYLAIGVGLFAVMQLTFIVVGIVRIAYGR